MKYRMKPIIVEAEQWFLRKGMNVNGVHERRCGGDTWYEVPVGNGLIELVPGDWVITDADGQHEVMSDSEFHEIYEPIEG